MGFQGLYNMARGKHAWAMKGTHVHVHNAGNVLVSFSPLLVVS